MRTQWSAFLRFASMTTFASLNTLPDLPPGCSRLYLCRHGQTDANQRKLLQGGGVDTPLNPTGRAQAAALAQSMSSLELDLVASSTLCRAVETADLIAGSQSAVERLARDELCEQNFGTLEGMPRSECAEQLAALNDAWCAGRTDVPVPGGESPDDVLVRACAALWGDGLLGSRVPGRHVAVVAHSTLNKAVLSHALGKGLSRLGEVRQANCCINVLDVATTTEDTSGSVPDVTVVAVNIKAEDANVPQPIALLRVCGEVLLSGQRAFR